MLRRFVPGDSYVTPSKFARLDGTADNKSLHPSSFGVTAAWREKQHVCLLVKFS